MMAILLIGAGDAAAETVIANLDLTEAPTQQMRRGWVRSCGFAFTGEQKIVRIRGMAKARKREIRV